MFIFKEFAFFIPDFASEKIKKIYFDGKVEEVDRDELKDYLLNHETTKKLNTKLVVILKKTIGDFEINFQ